MIPEERLHLIFSLLQAGFSHASSVQTSAPCCRLPLDDMRILLIEDEADLLAGLAKALREEGYAVDTAADGEEGLYKATEVAYDAIVLDVMLPHLDGWKVLERVRESRKTPVLMLTARDAARDRVRGLDSGADDYLVKPFDLKELFARLRATAPSGRTASPGSRRRLSRARARGPARHRAR